MGPKSNGWGSQKVTGRQGCTHREEGHMTTTAETGETSFKAMEITDCWEPQDSGRFRKDPSQETSENVGPRQHLDFTLLASRTAG